MITRGYCDFFYLSNENEPKATNNVNILWNPFQSFEKENHFVITALLSIIETIYHYKICF